MRKKMSLLIIIIFFINFLGGCWSNTELTQMSVASAIGVDKKGEEYIVTAQLINPDEIAGAMSGTQLSVYTYRTTGKTVFEALRKFTLEVPRKIYLGHIRLLLLGEELAREDGIAETLDFFSREHQVRSDFYILIAKNSMATEVLNILTPIEKIPADKLYNSLDTAEKEWGGVHGIYLDELISQLVSEGKEAALTGIFIKGDLKTGDNIENLRQSGISANVQLDSMAVFQGDRLIGWLNETENKGYNAVIGNIKSSILVLPFKEDDDLTIEIIKTKSNIKAKEKEGKPKIEIRFKLEGNIGEITSAVDLENPELFTQIEKRAEEEYTKLINASIKKAQKEFHSDIFGFGEVIHRENPQLWNSIKKNWKTNFENLEIEVYVDANIKRAGTMKRSFIGEIK